MTSIWLQKENASLVSMTWTYPVFVVSALVIAILVLDASSCFCLCEMNKRFVLFRYSMNDISTMVETLDGEQHAINTRETRNNRVVSSKAEDACIDEQDTERTQTFTFAGIIENGWFKERQTILQVHPTSRNKTTKVMLLFVEEFFLL
jgi:hypothetical protein